MTPAVTRVLNGALRRVLDVFSPDSIADSDPRIARLLPAAVAAPETTEERLIVETLANTGRLAVDALVAAVADALYREELVEGGNDADLSLLGASVFIPDVLHALEAGDGRLWALSVAAPGEVA
jgi:hypothetical protein